MVSGFGISSVEIDADVDFVMFWQGDPEDVDQLRDSFDAPGDAIVQCAIVERYVCDDGKRVVHVVRRAFRIDVRAPSLWNVGRSVQPVASERTLSANRIKTLTRATAPMTKGP